MALYTFFLRRHDGDATSFEVHDLADDGQAMERAQDVQAQHRSAAYVEVFAGDREIVTTPAPVRRTA